MNILVIDGQGGRLGRKLLESIRKTCPEAHITAVGTNSMATEYMMNSNCANQLATGENAVIVACRSAQIIVGPFGIATADAMMGEISPAMANAVASSAAYRVLIPMNLCNTYVAGIMKGSAAIMEDAMNHIQELMEKHA
jgi:threonine/homoserine efflux transporter RhtA